MPSDKLRLILINWLTTFKVNNPLSNTWIIGEDLYNIFMRYGLSKLDSPITYLTFSRKLIY